MLGQRIPTNIVRDIFNSLGCETEKFKEGYFIINVLADQDYKLFRVYDKMHNL